MERSLGRCATPSPMASDFRQFTVCRVRRAAIPLAVACAFAILCAAVPAGAALYKWTDANGRVVYSDQPPPGDVKVDTIASPPPPANPNAVKEMATKEAEGKKQQGDAADNAKKAAQSRADATKMAGTCKDARLELNSLAANQILLYRVNEKGETVYMDDAERRRRRENLETFMKSNCPRG